MNGATERTVPDSSPLRVLVIEDTSPVAELLAEALQREGMMVELAASGREGLTLKPRFRPDVVLVDLGLPDMDGLALVERLARDGDCGIIVVTAHAAEQQRLTGLEIGADDYIVKPAPLRELAARIRAVHRRLTRPPAAPRGPLVAIETAYRRLAGPGRVTTALTEAEYSALRALLEAGGNAVSRDWLGRVALKRALAADDRSVDQLVMKLRRKLGLHGVGHRCILSSRGTGYVIPEPGNFVITHTDGAEPPGR